MPIGLFFVSETPLFFDLDPKLPYDKAYPKNKAHERTRRGGIKIIDSALK